MQAKFTTIVSNICKLTRIYNFCYIKCENKQKKGSFWLPYIIKRMKNWKVVYSYFE